MLNKEERKLLDEAIEDAVVATRTFLESNKQVHFQLLQYCVGDALDVMTLLGYKLTEDKDVDQYRLRMLVPTQVVAMIDPDFLTNRMI